MILQLIIAIWVLGVLFKLQPEAVCEKAAWANANIVAWLGSGVGMVLAVVVCGLVQDGERERVKETRVGSLLFP